MLISYKWLQTYFDKPLPAPEKLADLFTFHFSEVESVKKVGDDSVFELKILTDRANYALSHFGVASEISAFTGLQRIPRKEYQISNITNKKVQIKNEEPELCLYYGAVLFENIKIEKSSTEIQEFLEAVGSRAINNIVDATNYLMLSYGQPLHAFDADKIKGGIIIRKAKAGEKITLLDG